jgi:hypothetical protein
MACSAVNTRAFREITLSDAALESAEKLSRWPDCPFLITNPRTRRPYKSLAQSWDSVPQEGWSSDAEHR